MIHILITDGDNEILNADASGCLVSFVNGEKVKGGAILQGTMTSEVGHLIASQIFLAQDLMDKDKHLVEFVDVALAEADPTWTREMKKIYAND